MMFSLREIYKQKKSDTCVLLGSGPSINFITKEEWDAIRACDIWTLNNWIYHPTIVPDFYHVEAKYYNFPILKRRFNEKRKQYQNVKYLFEKGKGLRLRDGSSALLHTVVGDMPYKYEYAMIKRDPRRTDKVFTAKYVMQKSRLTKSYDMSIAVLLELIYRLGYKHIVIFGIDLYDSTYFWTGGNPVYGEVHHQWNKQHEGKDKNLPHSTHKIKSFIVDFNFRWMVPANREILVGHTRTNLYPDLKHVDIRSIKG